jgi:tetratricopeptide (TPR) repeat protein
MKMKRHKYRSDRHSGQRARHRVRLSLCMIVKNEAENLGPCLTRLKPVLDEIILVDTGSSDDTREVARRLGAKVFDFPWRDDFSAARNESLRHATGDYILWLDGDDRLDPSEVEKLRHLKRVFPEEKDQAYYLLVNNQTPMDGETLFYQMRIFPNVEGAAFKGRIHEQIFQFFEKRGTPLVKTKITIRHTGYNSPEVMQAKSERNLKIAMKELESDPNNSLLLYNAARTLSGLKRPAEAIVYIKRIAEDEILREKSPQFYLEASLLLGKYYVDDGRFAPAVSVYDDLARRFQKNGLVHFCLGQALFLAGQHRRAANILEESLSLSIDVGLLPLNFNMLRFYQYYTLGECYAEAGQGQRAKEMLLKALEFPSDHRLAYACLGRVCLQEQRYEDSVQYCELAIEKGARTDANYANLGLSYRKVDRLADAERVLRQALEINPERVEARIQLGYILYQNKDYPKAMDAFTKVLDLSPDLLDPRFILSEIYFRFNELDTLVQHCDRLRKQVGLSCDVTLNNFEELGALYEEIGTTLSVQGRVELSLMAYRVALLICPSKRLLEVMIERAKRSETLNRYMSDIKEILGFHLPSSGPLNLLSETPTRSEQNS